MLCVNHVVYPRHSSTITTLQPTSFNQVDDDTYVNAQRLVDELTAAPKQAMFMGYMEYKSHPHRDPKNQWFVSKEDWPTERYLWVWVCHHVRMTHVRITHVRITHVRITHVRITHGQHIQQQ